ncbi:hypothetical protein [Mycobacterium camsae]|uniref:hypothetical protein n=1 Tax=Mycobacterium gordonae TaxID=1778 RepID=UPI00197F4DA5|nr:hypothetical protein [Mycobacterium gordonae]
MIESMDQFLASTEGRLAPEAHHTAVRLANQARQKLADLYSATEPQPPVPDPFTAGAVTDEWIAAVIERSAQQDLTTKRRNILVRFIADADNRAKTSVPDTDAVLRAYHGKLVELLDNARELVDQLDGANNAETAIDKGVGPQWKQLSELARDYQQLRNAQESHVPQDIVISARPSTGTGEHPASDLFLRNLDDIWPHWRQPDLTPRTIRLDGRRDRTEPWPTEPVPQLIWLATSQAEPWIPTIAQLRTLWRQRKTKANPQPRQIGPRPTNVQVTYGSTYGSPNKTEPAPTG